MCEGVRPRVGVSVEGREGECARWERGRMCKKGEGESVQEGRGGECARRERSVQEREGESVQERERSVQEGRGGECARRERGRVHKKGEGQDVGRYSTLECSN